MALPRKFLVQSEDPRFQGLWQVVKLILISITYFFLNSWCNASFPQTLIFLKEQKLSKKNGFFPFYNGKGVGLQKNIRENVSMN
jgi:hypothetical protein